MQKIPQVPSSGSTWNNAPLDVYVRRERQYILQNQKGADMSQSYLQCLSRSHTHTPTHTHTHSHTHSHTHTHTRWQGTLTPTVLPTHGTQNVNFLKDQLRKNEHHPRHNKSFRPWLYTTTSIVRLFFFLGLQGKKILRRCCCRRRAFVFSQGRFEDYL